MTLEARNIKVEFGGVHALDDVTIVVERSSIVGLVGPNGAGKSTLFNCIAGLVAPRSGTVLIDGTNVSAWPSYKRAQIGLGRTFQTPRVDLESSLLDAVMLGSTTQMRQTTFGAVFSSPASRREERSFRDEALDLIQHFELGDPLTPVGELPLARLRLLEVIRCVAGRAKYLLLDEPAAGMDAHDIRLLREVIQRVAERGCGVLLVEHNFGFVTSTCENVTVLVSGRLLVSGTSAEIRSNAEVANVYLGGGQA